MNKKALYPAIFIAFVLLLIVGIWKWMDSKGQEVAVSPEEVNTTYRANIEVDPKEKVVAGSLAIKSINDTGSNQNAIYFHLYPNVFRNDEALTDPNWGYVLGKTGRKAGGIDINRVLVNGKEARFQVDGTILEIPLQSWNTGDMVTLNMDFKVKVPLNIGRFSYDAHSIWLGNWLPIRAVYDEDGWNLDPYYPIGDPFYSDVADYDFMVTVPEDYQLASTGIEGNLAPKVVDGKKTYTVSAKKVRDFAMVIMDRSYEMMESKTGETTVRTWYLQSDKMEYVENLHTAGVQSLAYFSENYGPYPYEEYDLVQTGGFFGGMEYPGIVFIQGAYYTDGNSYGINVVAHETAHQWWYGIVGNNEVDDPWMDEGLTSYATLRFLLDYYPAVAEQAMNYSQRSIELASRFAANNYTISSSVEDFPDWSIYSPLVYGKGAMMFYELEKKIGLEKMNQALRAYYDTYQYENANANDMLRIFEEQVGVEARSFLESWLY